MRKINKINNWLDRNITMLSFYTGWLIGMLLIYIEQYTHASSIMLSFLLMGLIFKKKDTLYNDYNISNK